MNSLFISHQKNMGLNSALKEEVNEVSCMAHDIAYSESLMAEADTEQNLLEPCHLPPATLTARW